MKRVIDHNKGRVKVAIALKNSHNQWQQTNANNKEGNRKKLKAPTAKHIYDTDNFVDKRKEDKKDQHTLKEKHLERRANFLSDKTKASNSFDEEKQKMFAKFK